MDTLVEGEDAEATNAMIAAIHSINSKPGMRNGLVVFCGDSVGVGVSSSADTMWIIFSISPAAIKNSPVGTPSVFILN
jgi:peptide subunit release factor 1 (eRF1)